MTQTVNDLEQRRRVWVKRVHALADQITKWSEAQGWTVERSEETIEEEGVGKFQIPGLHIQMPKGELLLKPIALRVIGGEGRVDLRARPTLARVKLLPTEAGWLIMTDSNVPLRQPWDSHTFVQLAHDLIS